ncbi:hypothetical protein SBBP2_320044 [Burkholderiales bacterium]|nr:hypothetical protein SBBP2_320044 [Burkholderiales bacterium]
MGAVGVLFVFVAVLVPEATHLRGEAGSAAAA